MGLMKKFQQDLQNGMTLETALKKYNLTFKEAVEFTHKPITRRRKGQRTSKKRHYYTKIDTNISQKKDAYHVRKQVNGKSKWGGSYNSLEDAQKVRDYLDENGWSIIKINEACKKYGIERRRK